MSEDVSAKKKKKRSVAESVRSDYGSYFRNKSRKLGEQLRRNYADAWSESGVFSGVVAHVNGRTKPSAHAIKEMVLRGGGDYRYVIFDKGITHIVAANLPECKLKKLREAKRVRVPVVTPEWIVKSAEAGRLLPVYDFAPAGLHNGIHGANIKTFIASKDDEVPVTKVRVGLQSIQVRAALIEPPESPLLSESTANRCILVVRQLKSASSSSSSAGQGPLTVVVGLNPLAEAMGIFEGMDGEWASRLCKERAGSNVELSILREGNVSAVSESFVAGCTKIDNASSVVVVARDTVLMNVPNSNDGTEALLRDVRHGVAATMGGAAASCITAELQKMGNAKEAEMPRLLSETNETRKLTLSQLDPEVLNAIPDDVRRELLSNFPKKPPINNEDHVVILSDSSDDEKCETKSSSAARALHPASESQIDAEVLSALPQDMREEVLRSIRSGQHFPQPSPPSVSLTPRASSSHRLSARGGKQLRLDDGSCFGMSKRAVANYFRRSGYGDAQVKEMLTWPDRDLFATYKALKGEAERRRRIPVPTSRSRSTARGAARTARQNRMQAATPTARCTSDGNASSSAVIDPNQVSLADYFEIVSTLCELPDAEISDMGPHSYAAKLAAYVENLVRRKDAHTAQERLRALKVAMCERARGSMGSVGNSVRVALYEYVLGAAQAASLKVFGAALLEI